MTDLGAPLQSGDLRLEPLAEHHRADLKAACAEDPVIWPIYSVSYDPNHFDAQFDAFAAATGTPPRFVDGHQHVHHLPGVRNVVLDALARCPTQVAVRNTGFVLGPGIERRRIAIERTGGRALLRRLRERGIAHNPALNGIYDRRASDYRALMRHWLATVPDQGALLVCEPDADAAPNTADRGGAARARERAYLESADFDADLRVFDVVLAPVWRVGAWW